MTGLLSRERTYSLIQRRRNTEILLSCDLSVVKCSLGVFNGEFSYLNEVFEDIPFSLKTPSYAFLEVLFCGGLHPSAAL